MGTRLNQAASERGDAGTFFISASTVGVQDVIGLRDGDKGWPVWNTG